MEVNWIQRILNDTAKVAITIGPEFDRGYAAVVTSAPVDYDGFGTFTLVEGYSSSDGRIAARIVLVQLVHAQWQLGRYASGGGYVIEGLDKDMESDLANRLAERLTSKAQ